MKKIYLDYTQVGGNSFQLGFMNTKNLRVDYFMTIMWSPFPHIVVDIDSILNEEHYKEISKVIDSIRIIGDKSKEKLAQQLENIGYIKNPLANK